MTDLILSGRSLMKALENLPKKAESTQSRNDRPKRPWAEMTCYRPRWFWAEMTRNLLDNQSDNPEVFRFYPLKTKVGDFFDSIGFFLPCDIPPTGCHYLSYN